MDFYGLIWIYHDLYLNKSSDLHGFILDSTFNH